MICAHIFNSAKGTESDTCMRWIVVHPGIVYDVSSVRVRAFVPLTAPCGVRVRHPHVFIGTQNCTLSCSVCVFAVWRACKPPLVFSGTQKCTLSCSVCFFRFCFSAGRIHEARVSEKQSGLRILGEIFGNPLPPDFWLVWGERKSSKSKLNIKHCYYIVSPRNTTSCAHMRTHVHSRCEIKRVGGEKN